jgi:hypothetical protein
MMFMNCSQHRRRRKLSRHRDVALQHEVCLGVGMVTALVIVREDDPGLLDTLAALVPAVADGVVRDALLLSVRETDFLRTVADASGCGLVTAGAPDLLAQGARAARSPWVLALAAGMVPGGLWMDDVADAVTAQRPSVFTLRSRGGPAQALRAAALNAAASLFGRAPRDLGLVAPREALMGATAPRVRRLPSPLHDRRGPRRRS